MSDSNLPQDQRELLRRLADNLDNDQIKSLFRLIEDQETLHELAEKSRANTLVAGNVKRVGGWLLVMAGVFTMGDDVIQKVVDRYTDATSKGGPADGS